MSTGDQKVRESVRDYYGTQASFSDAGEEGVELKGPILGCGSPLDLAGLRPGEDVLDLGSGAGREVVEAAARVAPGGIAYGLDMTDEMLALALENRKRAGASNAVFMRGTVENIPLPDASIDVIISNCVINLSQDKPAVMSEMRRVLRPGGRLAIIDTVVDRPVPEAAKSDMNLWCACMSGAPEPAAYRRLLEDAGFTAVNVHVAGWGSEEEGRGFRVGSAFISGRRPASGGKTLSPPVPAAEEDLAGILSLLTDAGLPADGVRDSLGSFIVMRDGDGSVVGMAGIEVYGHQALLRSLCVRPDYQSKGLGARLTAALLRMAVARRCTEAYLLSTTAEQYGEKRGFSRVERSEITGPVTASSEFQTACPRTAVAMKMDLPRCCC
jgi:N-acetylglutamate synthase-like GNAT family acetyltransferase